MSRELIAVVILTLVTLGLMASKKLSTSEATGTCPAHYPVTCYKSYTPVCRCICDEQGGACHWECACVH